MQHCASMGTSYGPVTVRVCPSWVGLLSKRIDWLRRFLAWRLLSTSPTLVLYGNSGIYKNKCTSLWDLVLNSSLRKFHHGISMVETCYQLNLTKVDSELYKLDHRWSTKLTRPSTVQSTPSYHSDHQAAYSTVLSCGSICDSWCLLSTLQLMQAIFTARCYASAVLAMGLCLSVTSRCSIETAERIELVFGMWASFHGSTCPTLC